ncbi:MAG: D,D-heptose 1,7-bisphosphate phosphatase [Roseburia intestinalis]|jgi:D,D-heptose 1,7-bisphosphate phosphatase|nr:MAG: D,D-heptose 1,7-bisphosphate phosphatase [Roseburia intestinalis]
MKIVIMAGGKGTRIAQVNATVPKPMIPIEGKPILEYQIETLKNQGYTDIILIVGHMGNVIQEYFGDGAEFGVQISYIIEEQPLGTAGALYFLKDEIKDDFLLLNGDIIFDVNIQKFLEYHCKQGTVATILTHPNSHPYDSGIIIADEKKRVINWLHKEDERLWYKNRVNAGLHMLSPRIFDLFTEVKKCDLDRDILKPLIKDRELSVYDSPEYIKDMGTPDRYYAVIEDIKSGKVSAKNLKNKQKALFLDRDGTINKYVGFLTDINEFELLDGVADAIQMINESGYLAIVVTNQPVIARGEVSVGELQEIHNKMETLLGQSGAYIDDIFYCPHHPHKGYEGERPEYKIECECRKPKPGMLFAAAEKYNIDLRESWMIGDGENDIEAGRNAGCKVCSVGNVEIENVPRYDSLLECIKTVLEKR